MTERYSSDLEVAFRMLADKKQFLVWPVLSVGAPLYLYLNLFSLPAVPFHLDADQLFFWFYALRMSHGELIYRDFFQFTPPGTDLFFLSLIRLFGLESWVMNMGVLLLGIALCWVCFSIARQLLDSKGALLAAVLVLVLLFGRPMDATHHWFSLFWVLCALRIVMLMRTAVRISIAGALLAIASCFTQTAGVAGLVALLMAIAWEGHCNRTAWRIILRYKALLVMGFAITFLGLNAALIAKVGWRQLWYFQVTYPRRYLIYMHEWLFPSLPGHLSWRMWPDLALHLFVYVAVLVIYPSVLWICWKKGSSSFCQSLTTPMMLASTGFLLWLEIITRVNWTRLYVIAVPAFILLVWIAQRSGRLAPHLTVTIWFIVVCLGLTQTVSRHRLYRRIDQLPSGRVALTDEYADKLAVLMRYTKPGDFFFQAPWMNVYPDLDLRSPAFVDILWPNNVTRPEHVALTLQQLEQKQVKFIVWSPRLDGPEDPDDPAEYHLGPLRSFLNDHYDRILVFQDRDELWQRK